MININGIQKNYLSVILQYLYTDSFKLTGQDQESFTFWLNLLIYADYFLIQRLVDICSTKLVECIRVKNVVPLYLIAQSHNAVILESQCLLFIVCNEAAVYRNNVYAKLVQ